MLVGRGNANPLLDTRLYHVEFPDGGIGEFTTNVIPESLYSNIDEEGYDLGLLDGIISHRKLENAVPKEKGWYEQTELKRGLSQPVDGKLEISGRMEALLGFHSRMSKHRTRLT